MREVRFSKVRRMGGHFQDKSDVCSNSTFVYGILDIVFNDTYTIFMLTALQTQIQKASESKNFAEVIRLSEIAQRLQILETEKAALLEAIKSDSAPEPAMKLSEKTIQTSARGKLRINIRLSGHDWRISESTSAETVVSLMERLRDEKGVKELSKLKSLKVSRGPLISDTPKRDFTNPRSGGVYAYHEIPKTGLYVLTHSSTQEKVRDMKAALQFMGFSLDSYSVTAD